MCGIKSCELYEKKASSEGTSEKELLHAELKGNF